MISLKKIIVFGSMALLSCASGLFAMEQDDSQEFVEESPTPRMRSNRAELESPTTLTPRILKPRDGWRVVPQLRMRNNARLNNCGYIQTTVSLQISFDHLASYLMQFYHLSGYKLDPKAYSLHLFTVYVPLTNDLLASLPKALGLARETKDLSAKDKQIIAGQITELVTDLISSRTTEIAASLVLDEVAVEDGDAIAYFYEPQPDELNIYAREAFKPIMMHAKQELEKRYRWGNNKKDGIWFDFDSIDSLRPSVKFMTALPPSSPTLLQRVAQQISPMVQQIAPRVQQRMQLISGRPNRTSQSDIAESKSLDQSSTLSRSSKGMLLSRGSNDDVRPLASMHRVNNSFENGDEKHESGVIPRSPRNSNKSPKMSPSRSPEVSPRHIEPRKAYKWVALDPFKLFFEKPIATITTEIVDVPSGKC